MNTNWVVIPLFYVRLGMWLAWLGLYFVAGGANILWHTFLDRGYQFKNGKLPVFDLVEREKFSRRRELFHIWPQTAGQ